MENENLFSAPMINPEIVKKLFNPREAHKILIAIEDEENIRKCYHQIIKKMEEMKNV